MTALKILLRGRLSTLVILEVPARDLNLHLNLHLHLHLNHRILGTALRPTLCLHRTTRMLSCLMAAMLGWWEN